MEKRSWLRSTLVAMGLGITTYLLLAHKSTLIVGKIIFYLFAFNTMFVASALTGQRSWGYKLNNTAWLQMLLVAIGPVVAYSLWHYHVI